ncbi:MAG: TonB-dependent receptor [bacterium]|nr:TonB-dependent receptor [bacterium]
MKKILILLLVIAMLPMLSLTQTKGGNIYGTIVLADGSVIPGVLVELSGEMIGKKTTVSSEQGNFRFLSLPPGSYQVRCELEGFKTVIQKGINVQLGSNATLNVLMETSTIKQEVIVSAKAAVIDTRNTTVGVNVSKELIDTIPTARNPWTVLSSVPGIMIDRVDVGGADSGQQSNFLAGGGDADDTTWNVDGANITDPAAVGSAPAYLNINSYGEIQVTLGANDITAQTGGIQLNFVTKRAGNKTSGDFHLYVEDKAWEMNMDPTPEMEEAGLIVPGVNRLYMYGINLGGPIVKDKVWWFGSWAIQDIHKRGETNVEDATWLVSGYGKLNFQSGNTSGDFHLSYDAKKKWGRPFLSLAQQDSDSLWDQDGPGFLYYGGLTHIFGELMINVKGVATDGGFTLDPRGADIDPETGFNIGNEFRIWEAGASATGSQADFSTNRNTKNISMDGNYFVEGFIGGDHEIKFGVDYYTADTTSITLNPNQRVSYVYNDEPSRNYLLITPTYFTDVNFDRISAYFQDTITFGKLTANVGIRYDKESGGINELSQPYFTWLEEGSPHNGERMYADQIGELNISAFDAPVSWSLLSPRLSLTYDITGNGKNVVKLALGRYMSQSGNNLGGNYVPYRYGYANWDDANGDFLPQYEEVGSLYHDTAFSQIDPETNRNNVDFASDYNTPLLDELTLSFEKALTDDLALSVTGFYKKKHNLVYTPNSRGEYAQVTRGIMADGSIETADNWEFAGYRTVGGTEVPTYNQIETPVGTQYHNLKNSHTKYLGLQFKMIKKLSDKWMANVSFTYNDWKWHYDESEFLDMNNFDFFNEGDVAQATTGSGLRDIWVNSRWMFKLSGMYQLPLGLNFTAFFQAKDGGPQPLRSRLDGFNQGRTYFYRTGMKSGDERLPTFWMLNLGLEKTLKVSDTVTATLVVDWYNATNNQKVLKYNLSIGEEAPGEPEGTMWSGAGLFQFGVRLNF